MANTTRTVILLIILLLFTNINPLISNANRINLLPYEDEVIGRNSHAYLSIYGTPSAQLKEGFVSEISKYAIEANEKWGIPASAIIGMAIIESGYGTTRIALYANNLFGIKVWGYNPKNAWQLQGQPDEDYEAIPVIADYGADRKLYDESKRRDNWYRAFGSYKEAVDYLAGNLLLNQRYRFAKSNYENRLKNGWSFEQASKEYVYDIANAGYNHMGGEYYKNKVGSLMDTWGLYQYDKRGFKDVPSSHLYNKQISYLVENTYISGYTDGTFKPQNNLTRAHAALIIAKALDLDIHNVTNPGFSDIPTSHPYYKQIAAITNAGIMNGKENKRFDPNGLVTRGQMAVILTNAYNLSGVSSKQFKDVKSDHWAYGFVQAIANNNVTSGYADGTFKPNVQITRAHFAVFLYRVLEIKN